MKYYIEEQAWEVILSFFKKKNGIHNKNRPLSKLVDVVQNYKCQRSN